MVAGASDDDPSGIATYAQTGAKYGFGLLWICVITLPLMSAVQEICDRAALATGRTLAQLSVDRFGRTGQVITGVLTTALLVANTLNIAADLAAVGSGLSLLHLGPTWIWSLIAGIAITALVIVGSFERISLVFKILCVSLFAYVIVAISVTHDWGTVLFNTVVPHVELSPAYLALIVAVLGTTISPYLFYWQSAVRLEQMRSAPEGGSRAEPLPERSDQAKASRTQRDSRVDVFSGMLFSNLVMFAIIVATSETLHRHGQFSVQSASQAASALTPFAGSFAHVLFAAGFVGSGLLAVPVLAASGSVGVVGLIGKEWGFSRSLRRAPWFYAIVGVGTLGGTAISLVHVNAIKLLVLVALINGVVAGPLLVLIMLVTGSERIMGQYRNGRVATTLGWTTTVLMIGASAGLFATGSLGI